MLKVLKENNEVRVILEGNLVKKMVFGLNSSGFRKVPPKESVDREIKALQLIKDVPDVQRFVKRESDNSLYTEYLPGDSLNDSFQEGVSNDYFIRLREIIRQCESKGVYRIGHNKRDFLMDKEGNPKVIDFGNVLFKDDLIAKIPGVKFLTKLYTKLRIQRLQKRYGNKY